MRIRLRAAAPLGEACMAAGVFALAIAGCGGDDTAAVTLDAAAPATHDASAPPADASHDGGDASAFDASVVDAPTDAPVAADASAPLEGVIALAGTSSSVAGSTSFCALLGDGSVRCWGNDGYGQSGTGAPASPYRTTFPVEPAGLSFGVAIVAVGDTFAGAVQQGSTLLWGDDSAGELGNGAVAPSYTPRVVAGLGGATSLSLGGEAGCAVVAGDVKCWGSNTFGNVGVGTTTVRTSPVAIGVSATRVAVSQHACALTGAAGVTCWGRDDYGQLGRTSAVTCTSANVPCDPTPAPASITSGATELAVGATFTCAIAPGATVDAGELGVQCWGDNRQGQLGGGASDTSVHASPSTVSGLSAPPSKLATGGAFACALVSGGDVQCWGANDHGQLGTSNPASTPVTAVTGAVSLAAGDATACAILTGGTVECWGANDQGQLGIGSFDGDSHPPTLVLAR